MPPAPTMSTRAWNGGSALLLTSGLSRKVAYLSDARVGGAHGMARLAFAHGESALATDGRVEAKGVS